MNPLTRNPRLAGLALIAGGLVIGAIAIALGAGDTNTRAGNKGMVLLAFAAIGAVAGLLQVIWPAPPRNGSDDHRNAWTRSSWGQRIYWIAGGLVGIVAAAIAIVAATGKI